MRSNPHDVPPSVNIPDTLGVTPPEDRESISKFSTSTRKFERKIGDELDRFDVDEWYVEDAPTSSGKTWPGYVIRWRKDGVEYALVSDNYTTKKANAGAAFWWLKETRKRSDRPVSTAHDALAAAALPPGPEGDATAVPPPPGGVRREAHEVLDVEEGADEMTIRKAYREKMKELHPDQNDGDSTMAVRLNKARDELLDNK